jgi:hypothetical protein
VKFYEDELIKDTDNDTLQIKYLKRTLSKARHDITLYDISNVKNEVTGAPISAIVMQINRFDIYQ